ncbi:MAG: PAS domain-containing protein [Chloroflexi bacterium]|nr:PAS domain-containing protein [Chloroflexota bacterium]
MNDEDDPPRAAQRLAEVEALSGIGSWEWEIATDTLYWSDQLRVMYGMVGEDRRLGYDDFIGRVHPDDRDEVRAIVQQAFEGRSTFEIDHRIMLDDGAVRHIHSRGYVLLGADGMPGRMLGTAQDVTDARAAEEVRAEERSQVAAGQARDEVLALLAHDLRSPLAVVVGYVQLLGRNARDGQLEIDRIQGYVGRIEESARQMTSLLDDLLADAEPHTTREPLETEPTDLVASIRRIASHHAAAGGGCEILTDLPDTEVVRNVNVPKLERALHNLVSNAVKYSPEGGRVTIRLAADDDEARIAVSDEGMGIPQADLPRVFERFHRGANVAGRISGIGLGLTSVLSGVEAHGGRVEVISVEGKGSTFTIHLPSRR